MKHIKTFKQINEAIISYDHGNINNFIDTLRNRITDMSGISLESFKELAMDYDVEVVDYDTFYNELPESSKKGAPPKGDPRAPIFGLFNPKTYNIRIVVQVPSINVMILPFLIHIIKHENIHKGQTSRSKVDYILPDANDKKSYFSDRNEIMAFSQSISDLLINMDGGRTIEECMSKLKYNELYQTIKKNVDQNVLKRYHKYIYLYLEMEFDKKNG